MRAVDPPAGRQESCPTAPQRAYPEKVSGPELWSRRSPMPPDARCDPCRRAQQLLRTARRHDKAGHCPEHPITCRERRNQWSHRTRGACGDPETRSRSGNVSERVLSQDLAVPTLTRDGLPVAVPVPTRWVLPGFPAGVFNVPSRLAVDVPPVSSRSSSTSRARVRAALRSRSSTRPQVSQVKVRTRSGRSRPGPPAALDPHAGRPTTPGSTPPCPQRAWAGRPGSCRSEADGQAPAASRRGTSSTPSGTRSPDPAPTPSTPHEHSNVE